ncbi:hypothetical protein GCM10012282_23430 [Streptomyces lacrimifluminis]|uniref:Uncharacterized protein n=1 Tax=Streptomyces lacrimifluminis TaxID=1500077 RepID=A0A917KR98_9ACTN|nr:hypothetical protein GCM10012282_23430 [Streptomyces lacrimifluminis]
MTTLAPPPTRDSAPRHSRRAASPASGDGLTARARRLFTGAPEDPRWTRPTLCAGKPGYQNLRNPSPSDR